jgi:hypothetical protein
MAIVTSLQKSHRNPCTSALREKRREERAGEGRGQEGKRGGRGKEERRRKRKGRIGGQFSRTL